MKERTRVPRSAHRRAGVLACALLAAASAATWAGPGEANGDPTPRCLALSHSHTSLDPAARLPSGDSGWEYWELTAHLDSGHWLFQRFMITNAGPGDRNGVAIGRLLDASGETLDYDNGRRESRWTLSADRLRLDVGSSHLDLHPPSHRLHIDKEGVRLDLRYTPDGRLPTPEEVGPDGYRTELLAAASPVAGTLWLPGMDAPLAVKGRVGVTHVWGREDEDDLVMRRLELFSLGPDALYLLDLTTPKGERSRWLTLTRGQEALVSTAEVGTALRGEAKDRDNSDYWVPEAVELTGREAEGRIHLARTLLEREVLGLLPQPFRFLLSLRMKPRQVWADAEFDVTVRACPDRSTLQEQGTGVMLVTFLDPVSRP